MDARAAADRFLASPALSEATRRAYGGDVGEFCTWLEDRGTSLDSVDVRVLADYVAWLGGARRGRKLAPATISRKLAAVRAFLRQALGPERVPDARLGPRRPRRLPDAPAAADVERMLEGLEGDGPLALRNRPATPNPRLPRTTRRPLRGPPHSYGLPVAGPAAMCDASYD